MVATFSSLPPEIVGQILSFLPRPTINHGRVTTTSPLLATSLVSKAWYSLSQHFLFHTVALNGTLALDRWARTEACRSTVQLAVNLAADQSGQSQAQLELADVLWTYLVVREIDDQRPVEVLELELGRGVSVCEDEVANLALLQGTRLPIRLSKVQPGN